MKRLTLALAILFYFPNAQANGISEVMSDPITLGIIIAIAVTAILLHARYDRFAINHGPEILTTIGIFGCFIGIAVALLNFDSARINESVPNLLNGVKTAFWASVAGVLASLTIKFRHAVFKDPIPKNVEEIKSASLEDVVSSINTLRRSISGETDASLVSQIKLMRQEQSDNSKELKKSFDEFAQKVSELGSKALIAALEAVIKDFNTKLNEQFGENFKQLNQAVEKLVVWQQEYKESLDHQKDVLSQVAQDLNEAGSAFSEIAENAGALIETATKLQLLLATFDSQYDLMKKSQESLALVLADMKAVEPSFSQKLIDLSTTFKSGTEDVTSAVTKQVEKLTIQIEAKHQEFAELITKKIPEIQAAVNQHLKTSQDKLSENFAEFDRNLEAELQKALQTFGQQMASLSEKFVSDYAPLTEKLKAVVNISKGV